MPTAKEVFEIQSNLRSAQSKSNEALADAFAAQSSGRTGTLFNPYEAPEVVALDKVVAEIEASLEVAQKEIGGKVYRVESSRLHEFTKKIEKLNRKAAKLNCDPISFDIVETEEETRKRGETEILYTWNYTVLKGSTPMVPGYEFIAALDHTLQSKDGDPVILKRVPGVDEEIDISDYRYADARCEHCNKLRSRNTTYLVREIATGKISKVGSSCLRDFTGANDPHKVASYMEYLLEFDEESTKDGGDYSSGGRSEPKAVIDYLTHVAAKIRESGWSARSSSSFATADQAWQNMADYKKTYKGQPIYIEVTEEDAEIARKAIEWAKGIEGDSDFDHNLRVMAGLSYMPAKGDGIVAYIVQGYVKDETKRVEREAEEARKAEAEPCPVTEDRIQITGVIVNEYTYDGDYGTVEKMTVLDDRGFQVNGTVPSSLYSARKGDRVTFLAKIKVKSEDAYFAWYKRPTKADLLEKVPA